jgi:hypothetical protein
MIGMCWPVGDSGFGVAGARPAPRRARGTYGVYVVWSPEGGCRGGGRIGPARAGADCGGTGLSGVPGGESGKLMREEVGEDAADDRGVPLNEVVGELSIGTTSG